MKHKINQLIPAILSLLMASVFTWLILVPLQESVGQNPGKTVFAAGTQENQTPSILFTSDRSGSSAVFAMRQDGSGEFHLSKGADPIVVSDWQKQSGRILVTSTRDGDSELYEMNVDGEIMKQLTDNDAADMWGEWSPDGKKIVFASNRDGEDLDIYIMNADGSNAVNLTDNDYMDQTPTWSPDGKQIAYMSWPPKFSESIFIMDADGANKMRLNGGDLDFSPDWSPDGGKIAFVSLHWQDDYVPQIYVMDRDGSNPRKLTSSGWNGAPSWSPDGNWIAFESLQNGNSDIYLMKADGTSRRRLTDNKASDSGPVWAEASFVACEVPFFWQRDPDWRNHPLRTYGNCSTYCGTIGNCGCTLTSATMVFNLYGKRITPAKLSDCMGKEACPFHWNTGIRCAGDSVAGFRSYGFSFSQLERELDNGYPVLIGMHRKDNALDTHWVVAIDGEGSKAKNYVIHDPWFEGGANSRLDSRTENGYVLDSLRVFVGSATNCANSVVGAVKEPAPPALFGGTANVSDQNNEFLGIREAPQEMISGTVQIYAMTAQTMTLKLEAESSSGNVEEMYIWTDTHQDGVWQPLSQYVSVPVAENAYARFRDVQGNVSEESSDSSRPIHSPPPDPYYYATHLPAVFHGID